MTDNLIGKRIKHDGSIGEIVRTNFSNTMLLCLFYDGVDVDPDDPLFPVYSRMVRISEVEFVEDETT